MDFNLHFNPSKTNMFLQTNKNENASFRIVFLRKREKASGSAIQEIVTLPLFSGFDDLELYLHRKYCSTKLLKTANSLRC